LKRRTLNKAQLRLVNPGVGIPLNYSVASKLEIDFGDCPEE
jgi:hypothetical protein